MKRLEVTKQFIASKFMKPALATLQKKMESQVLVTLERGANEARVLFEAGDSKHGVLYLKQYFATAKTLSFDYIQAEAMHSLGRVYNNNRDTAKQYGLDLG